MRGTLIAGLLVLAAACNRTPPEPEPPPPFPSEPRPLTTAAPTGAVASAKPAGRCITPLPPKPAALPAPAAACPPDPEPNAKLPLDSVSFPDVVDGGVPLKIQVELAKNEHDIERGLMYRQKMGDDHGMLFKLDGRRDHTFWMRNTCIPLDMMFVDDDGTIVGIVEGAAPLTETVRSVGCPSSYVLEVNAGWSRKHGVAPGQKLAMPFSTH